MGNMNVGYARTSTLDQVAGFEAQVKALEETGCEKVFKEQVSSVAKRVQLDAALEFVREGDTLVVTKLDRLARSTKHLGEIVEESGSRAFTYASLTSGSTPAPLRASLS